MGQGNHVGPWLVEPDLNCISSDGQTAHVEPKAMEVLLRLAESPGETVSKDDIIRSVWPDTFVGDDVLSRAIYELRKAFHDDPHQPQIIQTISKRGYRLIAPVERPEPVSAPPIERSWLARYWKPTAAVAALIIIASAGLFFSRRRAPVLTEKDEILLADFVNTTGEGMFDLTLKTAIAVKLGESPFLNTVSDARVRDTLHLMQKPAEEKLVGEVAREACQRLNVKAVLNSSIARLGSEYVITLEALNCRTGEVLAREQVQARGQDAVLNSLGQATSKLRKGLGESIRSVQRFDTPLDEATTPSLEALKAFSLGWQQHIRFNNPEAARFYQRALELDPQFATAYHWLGVSYWNMRERDRAAAYFSKAFELQERASERERYAIMTDYYEDVTGELDKEITTLQLSQQSYPRYFIPYNYLGYLYEQLGWPDKALPEYLKAMEVAPTAVAPHTNAAECLILLGHYDEAAKLLQGAMSRGVSSDNWYSLLYAIAFVRGDRAAMERWAEAAPRSEPRIVYQQAQAKAFAGQLRQARPLYREAVKLALTADARQRADNWLENQSLVEAEFGNAVEARAILGEVGNRSGLAAIVLAQVGDTAGAQSISDEIAKRWPVGTLAQKIRLPLIRAAIAVQRGEGAEAIEALRPAIAYDLAPPWPIDYPVVGYPMILYLRGQAHLHNGDSAAAATAFQRMLDHRGFAVTSPIYPLAYVGLARARALAGDKATARKAYEQFFSIWKDADPDIPILRQAKAEYAKLN